MVRKIKDKVVVVTGASSGIGRATAHMLAEKGAVVVLAARREEALDEVVRECAARGGRARAVALDVRDPLAVQALADDAVATFGRIDAWVNNAAVTMFGRFEETPLEDYRAVIETNLFGYIHGARAALPVFRRQGEGVLVNVASIVAHVPQPYTSAYVISKHGVEALGLSLRQELELDEDAKDIHVCTVLPATIDTPLFQHAANYTGREAKALPPVYPPEDVAQTIVDLLRHPRREVIVGAAGRALNAQAKLMPAVAEKAMAHMVDEQHLYQDRAAAPTSGNLHAPSIDERVHGGWSERAPRRRRVPKKLATLAGVTLAGAGVAAWWAMRGDRAYAKSDGGPVQPPQAGPAARPQGLEEDDVQLNYVAPHETR